jgi:hypothetical protein
MEQKMTASALKKIRENPRAAPRYYSFPASCRVFKAGFLG